MVMRRGHHTSRVLEALGDVESQNGAGQTGEALAEQETAFALQEEETDGGDSDLPQQKT
jgi:hypothetical protein